MTDDRRTVIRPMGKPGDLGWVVLAHGTMYADEFGWDTDFEALVAGIVADYAASHDPATEAAWIAEVDGSRAGCVLCVAGDEPGTAKLRILLVDPVARGLGLGDPSGRDLPGLRRAGRIPPDHPVDQRRPDLRQAHLPGRRLRADQRGAASQLRARSGGSAVESPAVSGPRRTDSCQGSRCTGWHDGRAEEVADMPEDQDGGGTPRWDPFGLRHLLLPSAAQVAQVARWQLRLRCTPETCRCWVAGQPSRDCWEWCGPGSWGADSPSAPVQTP